MINTDIKINKNLNYINSWNIFSKLIILKNNIYNKEPFLIIVENNKILDIYLKIWEFLWLKIYKLQTLWELIDLIYNKNWNYIVTQNILNYKIDNFKQIEYKDIFEIEINKKFQINDITKKLNILNYSFSEYENNNSYNIKWDILSITNSIWETIKISFWWDNIEEIINWKNTKVNKLFLWNNIKFNDNEIIKFNIELKEKLNNSWILLIIDSIDFYENYDKLSSNLENYIIFNSIWNNKKFIDLEINDLFIDNIEDLKNLLQTNKQKKYIITRNKNTIKNFLELNNLNHVNIIETNLNILKSFKNNKNLIICDDNISRIFIKKRIKRNLSKNFDLLMQIKPGDYIVHIDHGIWIFEEIVEKDLSWIKKEYITIKYKNNDKLFVPITEISRVSKYVWDENPKLTWLWWKEWEKKIQKAMQNIEVVAQELLEIYANRKLQKWFAFKSFKEKETIFFNSFDYIYTNDQLNVIKEIYNDMEIETPMDRLLCWDVWFGKTEIAFASIYKAIINKKQVALISPLVVLAYEHYEKAKERFSKFWINIEVLTRFEKPNAIKNTIIWLKNWTIDLIIWTHRLLSEDIIFKNLWLLIIDEEHKFWVSDKEKIKKYKLNIDILSMSATPIPRSLNMALNWIKSISMLTTPPIWRQAISTIVTWFNEDIIYSWWIKEFDRWWQIFFIHNRVETIETMKILLQKIFPKKRIIITHWQLIWDTLERRIIEFKKWQWDILLSTTVIENGIDFSNVNTIFINDAQNFWISQIHQLRWRVWRSDKKWHCYLLFKKNKIKEDAIKRLKTIVDYSHLWAWFELAIKDLEIRWWWDILGIKQSGQSQEIWVNLFLEMLENKIEELKNKIENSNNNEKNNIKNCSIDLNIWAYIDNKYFTWELDKINFYREIESLDNIDDLENIIDDFKQINKELPKTTNNFFNLLKIKLKAQKYKITSIKKIWINYQIEFDKNIDLNELKAFLELDKKINFSVVNLTKLRSSNKNFENEEKFIQYLLQLFENKILNKKIKKKI